MTFETGANAGRTIEVKSWTQASAGSSCGRRPGFPLRWAISCGSIPAATSACSRTAGTGSGSGSLLFDKGNVRNFRGEPYVPGSPLTAVQAGQGF